MGAFENKKKWTLHLRVELLCKTFSSIYTFGFVSTANFDVA